MTRILLIEDEEKTARFIKMGLEESQYNVELAHDGFNGLQIALLKPFDIIITDIMLPGLDGWAICKKIREHRKETPILMLSALNTTDDVVNGFELGADDYLVKP